MFSAGKFSSNDDLVNSLQAKGLLKTDTIIAAFRGVDRGAFFPKDLAHGDLEVYEDRPLKIGLVHQSAPQCTCAHRRRVSLPHSHASCSRLFHKVCPHPRAAAGATGAARAQHRQRHWIPQVPFHPTTPNPKPLTLRSLLFAWFAGPNGTNHGIELHASNVELARRAMQLYVTCPSRSENM